MRIIISALAASLSVAAPAAWAEAAPADPARTEVSQTPVAADDSADPVKPVAQKHAVKPRESGLDQPLCTGE